jgi:hypothetical protein
MNYILTQRLSPSNNDSAISPKTKRCNKEREIARLLDGGFIKEVYHPDCLAYLYLKRIKTGGCVLIIPILIRHAKMIPLACPKLIRSWTPQPVAAF